MSRHHTRSRRAFLGGSAATAASAVAACGPMGPPGAPAGQTTQGAAIVDREVVVAIPRDMANGPQDPFFLHSTTQVWEPLVGLDNTLKPVPALAEKWELSADGRTWTFKLRPNVKFSDGTPFDADAVVANMRRSMKISPRPGSFYTLDVKVGYGDLSDVRKVDGLTVTFHLEQPALAMLSTMSNFFSAMYHPNSFAENGDFTGLPVATGPFKAVEWKRGEYLLLERNEGYWGTKPLLRRLRLRTVPDANARLSALLAQEIDAVAELGGLLPAQAQHLKSQPGITVGSDPIALTQHLAFNCAKLPFDDVRLRRAVMLVTDREVIVKDLILGYATVGRSLLSPLSVKWFSAKGTPRFAPAEGQRLAAEALGGRKVEVELLYNSSTTGQARPFKAQGELLQVLLRPLGIELKLVGLEGASLTDRVNRGEWHLRFTQLGWANGDPDFVFDRFLKSTGEYNASAKAGYKSAEADDLIAAGKIERDEKKRFVIYERLQELSVQDVPVLVLYHEHVPYAYRDTVSGLKHRVTWQPTFDTMRLSK